VFAATGHSVYVGGYCNTQPCLARLTLSNGRSLVELWDPHSQLVVDPWRPRLPGPVTALALSGSAVIVAGSLEKDGRWYVASIDPSRATVRILGYTTSGEPDAIAADGRNVYIGGDFGLKLFRRGGPATVMSHNTGVVSKRVAGSHRRSVVTWGFVLTLLGLGVGLAVTQLNPPVGRAPLSFKDHT
jgi:hypothetical protein